MPFYVLLVTALLQGGAPVTYFASSTIFIFNRDRLVEGKSAGAFATARLLADTQPGNHFAIVPPRLLKRLIHVHAGPWHFFFVHEVRRAGFIVQPFAE